MYKLSVFILGWAISFFFGGGVPLKRYGWKGNTRLTRIIHGFSLWKVKIPTRLPRAWSNWKAQKFFT